MKGRRALYVSDLDGTLLGRDARLSERSHAMVAFVLEAGLPFTVASARSLQSMRPLLGELPLSLPVVALNGALVTDFHTGRHERLEAIEPAHVAAALEAGERQGLEPFVTSHDGTHDNLYIPPPGNEGMGWYRAERHRVGDPRLREGYDRAVWSAHRIVALTFIGRRAELEPLLLELGRRDGITTVFTAHIYTSGWYWLTLHSSRARKDLAVAWLRERYGFEDAAVVAFGDQPNDLPLLRYADYAIAVANAEAEVKEVADEVIGANDEDAVARYLLSQLQEHSAEGAGRAPRA